MIKKKKPTRKIEEEYEDDTEEYEDDENEENEQENSEDDDETENDDDDEREEKSNTSNAKHRKLSKTDGGKTLTVSWLKQMEQNQERLEQKIDQLMDTPNQIQEMITDTIAETLSGMSLFRISQKSSENKHKPKSAVDQREVKTKINPAQTPTKKPLISRRKR